ncbi:MAG: zinc-binding alcohol dehydrogenase family protein, partial [Bosea sp. (in: a-proteobacteria)]|nr:zinc-binding alcohol dehydrogenase family protein [Bosea sp. (in: a-proteobacteria)]
MRAIGYREPQDISADTSLIALDLPEPVASGRDLLVEVRAISVNPVDTKVRRNARPPEGEARILGWDAAGVVKAVGPEVTAFRPGDAVFYAGALNRPGANMEFHLVDERIVGPKPKSLSFAEAAALPLTMITAWEMLFDRLKVRDPVPGAAPALLVVGGAGGVGSAAIQLARRLTDLTVIATASRPETRAWANELGAHHVVDHSRPLADEVAALGLGAPGFVFFTTHTAQHLPEVLKLIAPQGRLGVIDDPATLDVMPLKNKSLSLHWELMFTRSLHQTPDMQAQ